MELVSQTCRYHRAFGQPSWSKQGSFNAAISARVEMDKGWSRLGLLTSASVFKPHHATPKISKVLAHWNESRPQNPSQVFLPAFNTFLLYYSRSYSLRACVGGWVGGSNPVSKRTTAPLPPASLTLLQFNSLYSLSRGRGDCSPSCANKVCSFDKQAQRAKPAPQWLWPRVVVVWKPRTVPGI